MQFHSHFAAPCIVISRALTKTNNKEPSFNAIKLQFMAFLREFLVKFTTSWLQCTLWLDSQFDKESGICIHTWESLRQAFVVESFHFRIFCAPADGDVREMFSPSQRRIRLHQKISVKSFSARLFFETGSITADSLGGQTVLEVTHPTGWLIVLLSTRCYFPTFFNDLSSALFHYFTIVFFTDAMVFSTGLIFEVFFTTRTNLQNESNDFQAKKSWRVKLPSSIKP